MDDLSKVFHMNGGDEPTSYSRNSSLQKRAADGISRITSSALTQMLSSSTNPAVLSMADLGCSSGPNALSHVKRLLEVVDGNAAASEIRVYLNDLPTNDFNAIFKGLPDFLNEVKNERDRSIYIGAYPGNFYGRLFPDKTLNFVYSFNSLHWLSRIPQGMYDERGSSVNKRSIYITERSPPVVSQIYYRQFREDFSSFLKSRSDEVIAGGKMVLLLLARSGAHHYYSSSFLWEILYESLSRLVAAGEVEEERLESYDVHFYAPSEEEIEEAVKEEGSFELDVLEIFEVEKDPGEFPSYGAAVAGAVRSMQESMMSHHFGFRDGTVLDKVFDHFGASVDQRLTDLRTFTAVTVLTRL
ncbi:hypothetical protein M569_11601 [Genlisea aurea]|uniref:Uncharacterized protein n=1 Tax=Genlisea aurea TaxID=192259 RepID=S8CF72_9LAMI|nr:hypothetical protein M569_11601 [Genlisea aurea]